MSNQAQGTTIQFSQPETERVVGFVYNSDLLEELKGLSKSNKVYDVIIIDAKLAGFFFPVQVLVNVAKEVDRLLCDKGYLVFIKTNQLITLSKDSLLGKLSFQIFDSLEELDNYAPSLAAHARLFTGDHQEIQESNTGLEVQILMAAVPLLPESSLKLRASPSFSHKRKVILCAIDNYSPLSVIAARVAKANIEFEELKAELKQLEQEKVIFPLFAKIPFLVRCLKNQTPFQLKDYFIASELVSKEQVSEGVLEQQRIPVKERLELGTLCIAKGYITSRQFELAMYDLSLYGQGTNGSKVKLAPVVEQLQFQSLVGHLGTTDPAGLLQNLTSNRENGVLLVENRGRQFRCLYSEGRITHARMDKIRGNEAVIEFVSVWSEGTFVFMYREPPPDLISSACELTKPLDKLLLNAALAHDNQAMIWDKLPQGTKTLLEKLPDENNLLQNTNLVDPLAGTPLAERDLEVMRKLWQLLDGLTPLAVTMNDLSDVTTTEIAYAVDRLSQLQLIKSPQLNILAPLDKFKRIIQGVAQHIGTERNIVSLRLSLQAILGYSGRARIFIIEPDCDIGVDIASARASGFALSEVVKDIEDWQVKYVEYLSQELERDVLRKIVYQVYLPEQSN